MAPYLAPYLHTQVHPVLAVSGPRLGRETLRALCLARATALLTRAAKPLRHQLLHARRHLGRVRDRVRDRLRLRLRGQG